MSETREEKLRAFVDWAGQYITGDEKGQAQLFLDRLFKAFGQPGSLEVGGAPEMRIKQASEDGGGTAFADYVWKPIVLIEMKKRGVNLRKHYRQAFDYWTRLVPNRPRYVVLCNFDEFHVYDFDRQVDEPVDVVALKELPERWGPLAFLFPTQEAPKFGNDREKVTREAADRLATCYTKLEVRKVDPSLRQRFILQCLVALFAEDIGLLERYTFARLLDDCKTPADSFDLVGGLFEAMNRESGNAGGRYKDVRYFNGGLFREPARVELYPDELSQLRQAAESNWAQVSPEIFGTLFEHSMGKENRHAFGAHYTSQIDILKIVKPTIVDPWTSAINSAGNGEALLQLLARLSTLRVLDPACGSGNFLYLAYREMKRLETRIRERLANDFPKTQASLLHVNARQFYGLDINPFAVELAKVTMMIGRKLAIEELHIANEPDLPLDNLDANFKCVDALITRTAEGGAIQTPWPAADVIIGNPPFLGAKRLKPEHGAEYVNAVRKLYPEVPGMADYCVYWIRRAHDHLPECTKADPFAGRAGLVGTQNIRNNQSRVGGLDHVVASGTIVEAVDNQPWSGEANVHVSIANWVKTPENDGGFRKLWREVKGKVRGKATKGIRADKTYELYETKVPFITSMLSAATQASESTPLAANQRPKRVFQGVTPGYSGFVLSTDAASAMRNRDSRSANLLKPYLIGRELVSGTGMPGRFLIDADAENLLTISSYTEAFKHLKGTVLPKVKKTLENAEEKKSDMIEARREHLSRWWTFWARRKELRIWLSCHSRVIAGSRTQRFPFIFVFVSTEILPGDKLQTFAFDDDYSFGIIQALPHCSWYQAKAARLKNDADYNYSSASVFETFPWPQSPTNARIDAVAAAGREVRRVRTEALRMTTGGLRAVYRTLELPGKHPLKDAHAALDAAVLAAYGFSAKADLLKQLLDLNQAVAAKERAGEAVTGPGAPVGYGEARGLVTGDCIGGR